MADIALTAAQIAMADVRNAEVLPFTALVAITKGQIVYIDPTTGKVGLADANDAGKQQARGVALNAAGAGQTVNVLKRGMAYGYTISGLNYDAILYLSDTAGALADAAGTMTVVCGRVVGLNDSAKTKVVYFSFDWLRAWS